MAAHVVAVGVAAAGDAAANGAAARAAAGLAWIPALTVSGGARTEDADRSRDGYVAGVSVELPLFRRGQDLVAKASAHERYTRARRVAAERDAAIAHERARQELAAARAELERFDAAAGDGAAVLLRAAESGYREGERSVVELIDARRARRDVDLRRVELQLAIKRAETAVRAALGEFE